MWLREWRLEIFTCLFLAAACRLSPAGEQGRCPGCSLGVQCAQAQEWAPRRCCLAARGDLAPGPGIEPVSPALVVTPGPAEKSQGGSSVWAPRPASTSWSQDSGSPGRGAGVGWVAGNCCPRGGAVQASDPGRAVGGRCWALQLGPLCLCLPSASPPPSATTPHLILRPSLLRPSSSCCLRVWPSKENLAVKKK